MFSDCRCSACTRLHLFLSFPHTHLCCWRQGLPELSCLSLKGRDYRCIAPHLAFETLWIKCMLIGTRGHTPVTSVGCALKSICKLAPWTVFWWPQGARTGVIDATGNLKPWAPLSSAHEDTKHTALASATAVAFWDRRQRKTPKPEGLQWNQDFVSQAEDKTDTYWPLHMHICYTHIPKYASWKFQFSCAFYPQEIDSMAAKFSQWILCFLDRLSE